MPEIIDPKVQGEPTAAPVPDKSGTPAEGGVANATPAQSPADAEALKQFNLEREKMTRDINQLKSTFQKREAQMQKDYESRQAALKAELEKVQVSGMDEETRKIYMAERANERVQELEDQLQKTQQEYENIVTFQNTLNHFRKSGIPDSELVTDGTLDDLVESGWNYLIRKSNTPPPPSVTPPPAALPTAPRVDAGGQNTPPSTKATWTDLEKKYGSREAVYEMIEQRRLPPSILPD